LGKHRFGNLVRGQAFLSNIFGQTLHCPDDFLPTGIGKRKGQNHPPIILCLSLCPGNLAPDGRGKTRAVSDDEKPDFPLHHRSDFPVNVLFEKPHQGVHFLARPAPIFP
jgi:hypothetical protein